MEALIRKTLRRLAVPLAACALFAGCSTLEVKEKTVEQTNAARLGPEQAPFRSITGFSPALRCMDNLLIDYGVRDVSMLVEDVLDQTKKVNAGTRDMLITAISDMTRRSRAVRVVAFGRDATNAISFLASAQRQTAFDVVPQYDIKGSVSQFDENVIRNQRDLGIGFQPFINLGITRDAASNVLGLDLSVLTTDDLSVLSGVTSRNSVVILKAGRGVDADAAYHKFGVSYTMSLSKTEGQTQALRGLVELAVIELMGKLTKTPYWTCLNGDPATNEEIKTEMSDWYYAMAASRVELIAYFQNQLRRRGFYQGPVDGAFNPAIDQAIVNYRGALGLSRAAVLDEAFFKAYLTADHTKIPRPAEPARYTAAEAAPAGTPPVEAGAPMKLRVATANQQTSFTRGEAVQLLVSPTRDAHVYCYLLDENNRVSRFFPNRFVKDSFVPGGRALALPGKQPFEISMRKPASRETVACFATPRDVSTQIPGTLFGNDFEPLPSASLEQIRAAFVNAAGPALAQETVNVQAK